MLMQAVAELVGLVALQTEVVVASGVVLVPNFDWCFVVLVASILSFFGLI